MSDLTSWTLLDSETRLLTRSYWFNRGAQARMAVVGLGTGELLAISPACGLSKEDFDALRQHGEVTAIIAPNGFHYMGLPEWRRAFPSARVYCPDNARKRIAKKCPDAGKLESLAALSRRLPSHVRVLDVPHQKIGEAWLEVDTKAGPTWYVSDSCFSMPELPKHWLFGRIFKWTKSAPGLRINGLGKMMFVTDKPGYKAWFLRELDRGAPTTLMTAHGDVVRGADLGERLRTLAQARL